MSYTYYIPFISEYCRNFKPANIVEIGTEYGTSFIGLTHQLMTKGVEFNLCGIDVLIRPSFDATLQMIPRNIDTQRISLIECNSLEILHHLLEPDRIGTTSEDRLLVESPLHVALVDGDHNYYTVDKELQTIDKYSSPLTLIICDDYNTRHATKDMFYAERDTHAHIEGKGLTQRADSEKVGVRPAVDDFLAANPRWKKLRDPSGLTPDGCLLYREDNDIFKGYRQRRLDLPAEIRKTQLAVSVAGSRWGWTGKDADHLLKTLKDLFPDE